MKVINQLKHCIQSLFDKIGCQNSAGTEMLGNQGVTESNMMQYLGIIEQRTNEILQMFRACQAGVSPSPNMGSGGGGAGQVKCFLVSILNPHDFITLFAYIAFNFIYSIQFNSIQCHSNSISFYVHSIQFNPISSRSTTLYNPSIHSNSKFTIFQYIMFANFHKFTNVECIIGWKCGR